MSSLNKANQNTIEKIMYGIKIPLKSLSGPALAALLWHVIGKIKMYLPYIDTYTTLREMTYINKEEHTRSRSCTLDRPVPEIGWEDRFLPCGKIRNEEVISVSEGHRKSKVSGAEFFLFREGILTQYSYIMDVVLTKDPLHVSETLTSASLKILGEDDDYTIALFSQHPEIVFNVIDSLHLALQGTIYRKEERIKSLKQAAEELTRIQERISIS